MSMREKGEGFPGQRIIVLPRPVVARALAQPLLCGLLPTDVGYFPKAAGHLRERPGGVDQAILIYCGKGNGWGEIAGRRHAVGPGDLLAVPPGQPHAYGSENRQPWTIYWLHAVGSTLPLLLGELGIIAERPVLFLGENPQLLELFEELLETLAHGYAPAQLLYAAQITSHLIGAMIWRRQQHWRGEPDAHQKVDQCIRYMKHHLDQPLRAPALAALTNLSLSHFAALFKQQTGYAPIDYFIRLRMHRACQLLDTTDLGIKQIALLLGYEDALYFSRLFRAVNEVSPKEYRQLRKG